MRPISTTTTGLLVLSATAVLLLAGCGTDAQDGASPPTPTSRSTGTPTAPEATTGMPVTTDRVDIVDFAYDPATVEVGAGTELAFTNRDDFAHTVTAGTPDERDPERFDGMLGDLGEMNAAGTEFMLTIDEPGTYQYFCRFHPDMRGRVVVTGG